MSDALPAATVYVAYSKMPPDIDDDRVRTLMDSNKPTESFIERARTLIDLFSQSNQAIPRWVRTYGIQRGTFKLDLLLTAMLGHAPSCAVLIVLKEVRGMLPPQSALVEGEKRDGKDTMDGPNSCYNLLRSFFLDM